ncbi:hypothetical protein HYH02_011363 [Chlamydomonas schloesseri]|uniref:TATA box binding protein associated factor (TAF) histone-like fold domain-containing protein n=1 Tax=Chlamydomonas schloesseri TaxID=2026947 RepID=A0A835T196_9CHLO|nr:hypothetical protein HYH02_011363 [Chlamydomonas schloesseri]|eukprot:KAG2437107.1 hypothetical protein HYH02_011363 [Chlamydomonas schloesseri]
MSNPNFITPGSIRAIALSVDVTYLTEEAAKALAPDVEYRLREVIQDALKFARHSKRTKLTTQDINDALRLRNIEPLYGFLNNNDPAKFVRATGAPDLYFVRDDTVPLEQITCAPLPKAPAATTVMPHWLFINGVQPQTEENAAVDPRPAPKRQRLAAGAAAAGAGAGAGAAAVAGQADAVAGQKRKPGQDGADAAGGAAAAAGGAPVGQPGERVAMPVAHILSDEMQRLLQQIKATLGNPSPATLDAGSDERGEGGLWGCVLELDAAERGAGANGSGLLLTPMQRAVLTTVQRDPGMQQLLPYLTKHVGDEVAGGLRQLPRLHMVLRLVQALMLNPAVSLEPYLHSLMPPLLTCLMAKSLGNGPTCDHWALRDAAAAVVARICGRFGEPYYSLQVKVSKQLLRALLDGSKPLPTHYGAVAGLAALGPATVRLLLLPQLEPYLTKLQPSLPGGGLAGAAAAVAGGSVGAPAPGAGKEGVRQFEATRVYGALLQAAGSAMYDKLMAVAADSLPQHLFRTAGRVRRSLAPKQEAEAAAAAATPTTSPGVKQEPAAAGAAPGVAAPAAAAVVAAPPPVANPAIPEVVAVPAPAPDPTMEATWQRLQSDPKATQVFQVITANPGSKQSLSLLESLQQLTNRADGRANSGQAILYQLGKLGIGPPSAAKQYRASVAAAAAAAAAAAKGQPVANGLQSPPPAGAGGAGSGMSVTPPGSALRTPGSNIAAAGGQAHLGKGGRSSGAAAAAAAGGSGAGAAGGAGSSEPASRSVRAVLAESWREDADLGEVVGALTTLFGPAFLTRLPQPPQLPIMTL